MIKEETLWKIIAVLFIFLCIILSIALNVAKDTNTRIALLYDNCDIRLSCSNTLDNKTCFFNLNNQGNYTMTTFSDLCIKNEE